MKTKFTSKDTVLVGLLISLKVVLSRITGISFGIVKITFGFIASAFTGFLFGPWIAAIAGALADLIGFFLFPQGNYFPGYTLTAAVSGLIYGFVLYQKKPTLLRIFIAVTLQALIGSLLLNTLWTSLLYNKAFLAILPARILKNVLAIPLNTFLLYVIFRYLVVYLKPLRTKIN